MGRLMQYVGTLIICNLSMSMGIMFAFPSSTLRLFESSNTTLHRPMTEPELAVFGSLSSIGALVGTPVVGVVMDRFGRKNSSIMISLFNTMAWAAIASNSRVEVLLSAMFVCGLSGSAFLISPTYISEICEESIRGAMCSGSMVFYGVGVLVSYLLGGFLKYNMMVYVCLMQAASGTIGLLLLKETPTCLMIQGMEKEAEMALAWYRRLQLDSKEIQEEMSIIRRSLNPELDDMLPQEEKQLKPQNKKNEKMGLWRFIKKSSSTQAAIYMTLVLVTASIFQGFVVLQVYAEPLFEEAIPSMSPNVCSILLSVVAIIAVLVAACLTELAGRRPLMIYASFATAASCFLLGIQLHLHWGPNWLNVANIYFYTVVYSLGAGSVPYVLIAEVFLPEVKSFISMLVIEWAWLCSSIILFIFNPLLKSIGLGPVFYIFSVISVLTAVYSVFFVPETKGLTIDVIQEKFTNKKKTHEVI